MQKIRQFSAGLAGLACLTWGLWAGALAAEDQPAAKPAPKAAAKDHGHASKGPHQGALIELGEEEYHGEIVLDDKNHTVTIYLLGANAKDLVAIDAPEVVINLKHGDKPEQFKLKASPLKADPKGKSSRFSLKDEELLHDLDHGHAQARLRVKIAGKSFIGKIEAGDHDHAKHDHAPKKKG